MNGSLFRQGAVALVLALLAACGDGSKYPSDDIVKLDLQEKFDEMTKGLIEPTKIKIDDKEADARQHVKVHATFTAKANQKNIEDLKDVEAIQTAMWGSSVMQGSLDYASEIDKKKVKVTLRYQYSDRDKTWEYKGIDDGHI